MPLVSFSAIQKCVQCPFNQVGIKLALHMLAAARGGIPFDLGCWKFLNVSQVRHEEPTQKMGGASVTLSNIALFLCNSFKILFSSMCADFVMLLSYAPHSQLLLAGIG